MSFLLEYFLFLFPSFVLYSFFSFSVSSLFGTQQQLTHPPAKSSTLPLRKMPVFQGVAPWHTNFILSCIISLRDSAKAHFTHLPVKSSYPFLSGRIMFLRAYCFVNVLTLSCLGILWFGTHPYYSLCVVYFYSERPPLCRGV